MPLPMELITMGASFIASAATTLFKNSMEKRQALFEMALTKGQNQAAIYEQVRKAGTPGFQLTRRIIALIAVISFFGVMLWAPIFVKDLPITVGLNETVGGFWFFTDPHDQVLWKTFTGGIVYTPLVTHMISAITGFFFGNQISK